MGIPRIVVLGIGNILFTDEGYGIRVVEALDSGYEFPDNVSVVDGGVLGLGLLGVVSEADHLIVVDAIRNQGNPGTLYRLTGEEVPARIRAKNSLHQVDFLETLTLCRGLDRVPETVIVGVEPADIETLGVSLTPAVAMRISDGMDMVLSELARLGVSWIRKNGGCIPVA